MNALIRHRVRAALSAEALREGASPWTITRIVPSICAFDPRYIKTGDAVRIIARNHKYNNRTGTYVKALKGDMHSIELIPINTMFGIVSGQIIECRTAQLRMYRRFNPTAMTAPLLRAHFNNDEERVLKYLRECTDCFGEAADVQRESSDAYELLRGIRYRLLHRMKFIYDPWNRHDYY